MFGPISLGSFTNWFVNSGKQFSTAELLGIGFIIIFLAIHWGRFLNDLPMAGD